MAPWPGIRHRCARERLHCRPRMGAPGGRGGPAEDRRSGDDAGAWLLRRRRPRSFHGRSASPSSAFRPLPSRPTSRREERRAALRDLSDGNGASRLHSRPVQRGRGHPERRHAPPSPSDRQSDPVPPAARPRAAEGGGKERVHGSGLRRHAPEGVPVRQAPTRAARRFACRRRAAGASGLSVLASRLQLPARRGG